jgi:hypothetical protein
MKVGTELPPGSRVLIRNPETGEEWEELLQRPLRFKGRPTQPQQGVYHKGRPVPAFWIVKVINRNRPRIVNGGSSGSSRGGVR